MMWKPYGPYGQISDCGHYTVSQTREASGRWKFAAYFKGVARLYESQCANEAAERMKAADKAKNACEFHRRKFG